VLSGHVFDPAAKTVSEAADDVNFNISSLGDKDSYWASGTVLDEAGNPVSGVVLVFSGDTSYITTTDQDGRWEAKLKGTVSIMPTKNGYHLEPEIRQVAGEAEDIDFTAYKQYQVYGRVFDSEGKGKSGVEISFVSEHKDFDFGSVITDGDGFWIKEGLWGAVQAIPVLEDHSFEPESLRITGPGAVEKLTVYYGYVVSGKAVDEDGMGIANVVFSFTSETDAGETVTVKTDADGNWWSRLAGSWRVELEHGDYRSEPEPEVLNISGKTTDIEYLGITKFFAGGTGMAANPYR